MRTLVILIALLACFRVHGQRFEVAQTLPLPDSLNSARIDNADFDNDGLLDVIILASTAEDLHYILFVKGDTVDVPIIMTNTLSVNDFVSYALVDYDDDNDIDIILFGSPTRLLRNSGNFLFTKEEISLPAFTKSVFADLNNDGNKELVGNATIAGEYKLIFLSKDVSGTWQGISDTLNLACQSVNTWDANDDGIIDIFVSGRFSSDSLFTGFLINDGAYEFTHTWGNKWFGTISSGDLNGDGFFDVSFSGINNTGNHINRLLLSKHGTYVVKDSILQLLDSHTFVADFDSDGMSDIQILGKNSFDETLNLIQTNGTYDTLTAVNIVEQRFADIDRDGDLDVIQLIQSASLEIVILLNNSSVNEGPQPPAKGLGIPIFDRFFLYWDEAVDDHTVASSITYDVMLEGSGTLQMGEFDLLNERRLKVSHGNTGTQNFKLYNNLPSMPLSFAIQAIDNSFTTFSGENGLCIGSGSLICSEIETENLQACMNEQVALASPPQSLWFSFAEGFLGFKDGYSFTAEKSDTLFYFDPTAPGCAAFKIFVIEINNTTKKEYYTRYACENETIKFGVEHGWESIAWSSLLKGDLGSQDSIDYLITATDSLFVTIQNDKGCAISRRTVIRISKPVLTVNDEEFIILKGQDVQLNVSGAENWLWIPADRLTDATIPNPIASPIVTTTYIVTGYDSLGCSAQAAIKITVEDTGFVPSLFTPNNDGKNDELKLYGLTAIPSFKFSIYNREGNLVYEVSNPIEATQLGWDGTRNGIKQPAGVYFWKVSGSMASGEVVRLNGKTEGSIVLVR
jgi:gliding motility-associated-like protein